MIVTDVPASEPAKLAGLGEPPVTLIVKSPATAVPPLLFTTCLITVNVADCCWSENVHVQFSPSRRSTATPKEPLFEAEPPFETSTAHDRPVRDQPEGTLSATV